MICRLWGLVEVMACPHGCRPDGGWLDDTKGRALLARSLEIGGRPHLPSPSATARQKLAEQRTPTGPGG